MLALLAMQATLAKIAMLALLAALIRGLRKVAAKKVLGVGVRVSTSLVATARRALTHLT